MKKTISITMAAVLIMCFSVSTATAGDAKRRTIEGIMIGTGIAILGAAIYNEIHGDRATTHHAYNYTPKHHKGHWDIRKVWIDPVFNTKWIPGHYNRKGKWVSGRYHQFLLKEGYYKKEKVWVHR